MRGEIVVAPFGASNQITSEIRIQNIESYTRTQFVVLKRGLGSGLYSRTKILTKFCRTRAKNTVGHLIGRVQLA